MNRNKIIIVGILFGSLLIAMPAAQSRLKTQHPKYKPLPDQVIADLLGWVSSDDPACGPCGGYFLEPEIIRNNPNPLPYQQLPTRVTAKGPTIFSQTGQSILQEDVRVTQPGRLTKADKAYVYRDRKTGKITHVRLVGHVRMEEHGKLMVSSKATLNLVKHTAETDKTAYRIYQQNFRMGEYNGWGTAEDAKRLPDGIVTLRHATYSTCSPLKPSWQLTASRIKLDHKKKRGTAKNAVIKLYNIPILYTPYISFSTENERKSGLLGPLFQNSTKNGFGWSQPYYFNLAPNVDMTFYVDYMSKRGVQFNDLFRY